MDLIYPCLGAGRCVCSEETKKMRAEEKKVKHKVMRKNERDTEDHLVRSHALM